MWDVRDTAQHYVKKDWIVWEELVSCKSRNIIIITLVDLDRVPFPPLHIKLGLIKHFTKALDKNDGYFTYLCQALPELTVEKLKVDICDGPLIH